MNPNSVNNFFGQKVSKAGINVARASDSQLLYKLDYNNSNQTFFGTNGNIQFGQLTNGGLGMQVVDSDGFVLFEMDGQTWYWYDKTSGNNVMQVGKLPDGTYGWAVAASGYNVSDGFA